MQDAVAAGMAEGVVDVFEAVQVDKQQRDRGMGALAYGHGLGQAVAQQHSVGQASEAVMKCLVQQVGFDLLAFRDVA